jgi:hypothetical protein
VDRAIRSSSRTTPSWSSLALPSPSRSTDGQLHRVPGASTPGTPTTKNPSLPATT